MGRGTATEILYGNAPRQNRTPKIDLDLGWERLWSQEVAAAKAREISRRPGSNADMFFNDLRAVFASEWAMTGNPTVAESLSCTHQEGGWVYDFWPSEKAGPRVAVLMPDTPPRDVRSDKPHLRLPLYPELGDLSWREALWTVAQKGGIGLAERTKTPDELGENSDSTAP